MSQLASPAARIPDAAELRRLRWRARRGLLENDLILGRFFERHAQSLSARDWHAVQSLLALDDNTLLELVLGQTVLPPDPSNADRIRVLHLLRTV